MMNHFITWRRLLWALALLIGLAVISFIIYVVIIFIWLLSMRQYPTHNFDAQVWFTDTERRYEISQDLIESEMLIGKTKSEVRQLLGDEGNVDESNRWAYYLGFRPGFANIDPDILEITFKEGKVIEVTQRET